MSGFDCVTCDVNLIIDFDVVDVANFQAFFNFSEMRVLIQNFCIYHINAPGQEEGASTLPEG